MESMQFVATLWVRRLIMLAATHDGSDAEVTVYVVDPARIDPQRDVPVCEKTMARSELGTFLQGIIDGGPLPKGDVSHPTPPPVDPKLLAVFRYAAAVHIDDQFAQVDVTETGVTTISIGPAKDAKGS